MLKNLLKYRVQLEKEFVTCGMAIRTLRLQEKEHRKTAKEDLKKFRSWQDNSIVRAYRESMIAKLMYIRAEILYEDKKSLIVKAALKVCIVERLYVYL